MEIRKLFLFVLSSLILHSCTLITEPGRIYNQNAHPPEIVIYNFDNIPPGKHINGTIVINFDPFDITSNVKTVKVFVDTIPIVTANNLPYQFYFDTNNLPEGTHNLSFYVYLEDDSTGLLSLAGAPSRIYVVSIFIDRTPPDSVTITDPVIENDRIQISWTESVNDNFLAYIFFKSVGDDDFVPVDTIYEKTETSYSDTSIADIAGLKYQYKVNVTTDPEFANQASSNVVTCYSGNPFKFNFSSFQEGPIVSGIKERVYFIADNKLLSFSANDESFISSADISGLYDQQHDPVVCNFNKDESRMYFYNMFANILCIMNSVNLNMIKIFHPLEGNSDMLIPDDNRIIFNDYTGLKLIDIETNTLLKFLPLSHSELYPAALNEDHSKLIREHSLSKFYIIDVTGNDLNIVDSVAFNTYSIQLKSTGTLLCSDGEWLYNSNTYDLIGYLGGNNNYFSVSADRVLTIDPESYSIPGFADVPAYKISLYNEGAQHIKDKFFVSDYLFPRAAAFHDKVYASDINTPVQNVLCYVLDFGE